MRQREKRVESKRAQKIDNFNDLITAVLEEPDTWAHPEYQTLRNVAHLSSSNPATFPKNTRVSLIMHDNVEDVLLSNNVVHQVESGCMLKRDNIGCDPVLQITDSSTKFCKFALNQSEHVQKQETLQSSDKNRHCITIKKLSQSNDTIGNRKTGVFVKWQEIHILKYSCEINHPAYSVMICVSLKNIGFSNVLVPSNNIPNTSNENTSTNNEIVPQEKIIRLDKKYKKNLKMRIIMQGRGM